MAKPAISRHFPTGNIGVNKLMFFDSLLVAQEVKVLLPERYGAFWGFSTGFVISTKIF